MLLALLWVVCLGSNSVLLGLSIVGTDFRGLLLTEGGLASSILGYQALYLVLLVYM